MTDPRVSAYIPCYNNAETIGAAVASLQAQTVAPASIVVVDDGSRDESGPAATRAGARVIRHQTNIGRGAARAAGMAACHTEFVACCDATNVLAGDFVAGALKWFDDPRVAAVFGRIRNAETHTAVDRWRARYLFREQQAMTVVRSAPFITFGTLVRRSAVQDAGGYDPALRHSEDGELGQRLLERGYDVVFDPALSVFASTANTPIQLLERYWRWTVGVTEHTQVSAYRKHVAYAWRHMVLRDVRSHDIGMALISGVAPHYCYWRTRARLWARTAQTRRQA